MRLRSHLASLLLLLALASINCGARTGFADGLPTDVVAIPVDAAVASDVGVPEGPPNPAALVGRYRGTEVATVSAQDPPGHVAPRDVFPDMEVLIELATDGTLVATVYPVRRSLNDAHVYPLEALSGARARFVPGTLNFWGEVVQSGELHLTGSTLEYRVEIRDEIRGPGGVLWFLGARTFTGTRQ